MKRAFSLDEARAAGLTVSSLRGGAWRRLGTELYCWSGLRIDPMAVLSAWQRRLPPKSIFGGATAAWLFGLDLDPFAPIEVVVPPRSGIRPQAGLRVRRCEIAPCDSVEIRGLRATSLHRTLADICVGRQGVDALVIIDMAVRAGLTQSEALLRYGKTMQGRAGARRLRDLAALAAPAESAMETRLRWILLDAGLPPPKVQAELRDQEKRFVSRADLYYPADRLVLEYDGQNHRDRLVEDNRRQNLLMNAGFRLLRFTASDIYSRPDVVVAQVRGVLNARVTSRARNSRSRSERVTSKRAELIP